MLIGIDETQCIRIFRLLVGIKENFPLNGWYTHGR